MYSVHVALNQATNFEANQDANGIVAWTEKLTFHDQLARALFGGDDIEGCVDLLDADDVTVGLVRSRDGQH